MLTQEYPTTELFYIPLPQPEWCFWLKKQEQSKNRERDYCRLLAKQSNISKVKKTLCIGHLSAVHPTVVITEIVMKINCKTPWLCSGMWCREPLETTERVIPQAQNSQNKSCSLGVREIAKDSLVSGQLMHIHQIVLFSNTSSHFINGKYLGYSYSYNTFIDTDAWRSNLDYLP